MKINMMEYLLKDVQQEIQNFKDYNKESKKAEIQAEESGDKYSYWHFMKWDKPVPRKAKIIDDLKMIRRLSIEFEKEFDEREL